VSRKVVTDCSQLAVMIRMADGSQRRIRDIRVLDEVATAEGRTGTVTHVVARRHPGPLVRVVAWGHSHLRCAPERPVLSHRGFVAAGDLTGDDWIALPRYIPARADSIEPGALVNLMELRVLTRGARTVTHYGKTGAVESVVEALPPKLPMTAALGRLLGLYAAEGSTTANKVVWTYGSHERDTLAPETVALIKEALGAEGRAQPRPNGVVNVVLYGKAWRLLFERLVPGTTKRGDKHLSEHVTAGDAAFLAGVLGGWYDGDGYVRVRGNHASRDGITVSARLALDMHAIAVGLGRRPAIVGSKPSVNRHAATRQYRWNVTLPSEREEETREGYCRCGCGERVTTGLRAVRNRLKQQYLTGHNLRDYRSAQDETHLWRKVREVIEEPCEGGYVFDLEVDGGHSYIDEGIAVQDWAGHGRDGR
jgi:hypothetical protein